jgi:hypothetical protein
MRLTDVGLHLDEFFKVEFGGAAAALSRRGITLLRPGPDGNATTYYVLRRKTVMSRADFQLDLEDPSAVTDFLGRLWAGDESVILTQLARKVLALAPHYVSVEETEDVSPFIYVMF